MSEHNLDQGAVEVASAGVAMKNGNGLSSDDMVEQELSYWRQKLAGIPAILELPTDRPRPPVQTFRAAGQSVLLPKSLKSALETLSEREDVSLFVVLLAAFQTLLSRYTRQDDIVVGIPIEGGDDVQESDQRSSAAVIRTDMSGDLTFRQLLSRVSDTANSVREHANVPWERLVEAVQPDRDASRHPVFQTVFSLEESEFSSVLGKVSDPTTDDRVLGVDLRLQLRDEPEGFAAHFTYSTDLFDAATIARMAGHFQKLLEGIIVNPDGQISKLPLLTDAEQHQLVVEWNSTGMEYARDRCVHQLFEAQAVRTPNATAVVFGNESLTYGELDRRANQLAHHLIKLGAKPDRLVGICLERSLEMVVGLFGVLKAGSVYVPLDPAYPRDRIAYMLVNSEAPLLLTQAQLVESLPATSAKVVLIDSDWPEIAKQSQENPALDLDPANRAYVIYTSGSTGRPKGVEILHRGVVNFLTSMAERPGMAANDRLLAVTTLCFDIAGLEIYLPLTQGASFEIVSREVASDGNQLLAKLATSGATVMQATPATWRMLLEAGWQGSPELKILVGGEAVPHKLAIQLLQRAGSVWNMYGPTETTIWSTVRKFETGETRVSIGRPIANTEIFILDKLMQPVPVGVAGELLIGGDGVAKGYLKRPELTAEKFVAHPFSQRPGARLYKTGDLVRYLPNGDIEFLGRIDHQIKIRGFRIELGEIEAALRQHLQVNETVVVAREDVPGEKRLVAYFVPVQEPAPSTAELRSFLKGRLPEYMLPSAFVALSAMPLTPNGKVNRRALPAPDQPNLLPKENFAAPKDVLESQLTKIWESVLNVRPIGVKHNFFELGGHSLLAVSLMQRVERAFGKRLPIATLLQAPTIEQLAAILRQKGWAPRWSSLVVVQAGGSKPPFFCVHGAGGTVVRFYDVARYLGSDQPVYGLQAQALDGTDSYPTRVEQMATHYLKEIQSVQPEGPYFLAGYSFGGIVAFEMAQQLIAQGHEPPLVFLFETFCPPFAVDTLADEYRALFKLFWMTGPEKWTHVSRKVERIAARIRTRLRYTRLPTTLNNVRKACLESARDYIPRVYPGRVIMFQSTERPLMPLPDPRAGWSAYAGQGLEIHEIPSNQDNILLEPQARLVANQLKAFLD